MSGKHNEGEIWCYVCDLEFDLYSGHPEHAGLVADSRGRARCRVCRSGDLRDGEKPVSQRQLSLAMRRLLDALEVNP